MKGNILKQVNFDKLKKDKIKTSTVMKNLKNRNISAKDSSVNQNSYSQYQDPKEFISSFDINEKLSD